MKNNPERHHEYILRNLKSNTARRICEILKQKKSDRSMNYVGCSIEELKLHIESQFQTEMSWDNYGIYKSGWI